MVKAMNYFGLRILPQHIMERKDHHSHRIDLKQIESYAADDIFWRKEGPNWFGLFKYNGKYYQIVAYFIDAPKRCVIKTCHVVNSAKILDICKNLKL